MNTMETVKEVLRILADTGKRIEELLDKPDLPKPAGVIARPGMWVKSVCSVIKETSVVCTRKAFEREWKHLDRVPEHKTDRFYITRPGDHVIRWGLLGDYSALDGQLLTRFEDD
jgi:hypothetical protein